jgi:hypothetical protein
VATGGVAPTGGTSASSGPVTTGGTSSSTTGPCTGQPARTSCGTGALCDGAGNCVHRTVACGPHTCDLAYEECIINVQNCAAVSYECANLATVQPTPGVFIAECDESDDCTVGYSCYFGKRGSATEDGSTTSCIADASIGSIPVSLQLLCSSQSMAPQTCPSSKSCTVPISVPDGSCWMPSTWQTCSTPK